MIVLWQQLLTDLIFLSLDADEAAFRPSVLFLPAGLDGVNFCIHVKLTMLANLR